MTCRCPAPLSGGRIASGSAPELAGAPGWELAAEIDFADVDAVSPIPDGPITIGGFSFVGFNAAVASTWRVQPGSGLEFASAAAVGSTTWIDTGGGQSAPNIRITFADFIADYDPTRRYIFQLRIATHNADAVSERVILSIVRPIGVPTGATAVAMAWAYSGFNGTANGGGFGSANSGGAGSADYTLAAGYDTLTLATSPGSASGVQGYLAQSGGDLWPAQTDQRAAPGNQLTGTPLAITAAQFVDPQCQLAIAFPTGNTQYNFAGIVRGLRALVA